MGKRRRRFQFCIRGFQSVRRLFLQLSDSRLAPAQTPARHGGGRQRARPRGACGGGGDGEIMAGSKSFLQAFPNLRLFSPSFSKESFGNVTLAINVKCNVPKALAVLWNFNGLQGFQSSK